VGDDVLLEVGPGLANRQELVESAVVLVGHAARVADRLVSGQRPISTRDGGSGASGAMGRWEPVTTPPGSAPHPAPPSRTIEAALGLFAEHGISGTSLQMIADALGVTKAAVYHQYNTKDEIVLAVTQVVLARLEAAVTAAEAERSRARARALLIAEMVDLAVEQRGMAGGLPRDPIMLRFLQSHAPFPRRRVHGNPGPLARAS